MELLRWRSFNQGGCAEPIGRVARLTMRAAAYLFTFALTAQVGVTAIRTGNISYIYPNIYMRGKLYHHANAIEKQTMRRIV